MIITVRARCNEYKVKAAQPISFLEVMGSIGLPFLTACGGKGICGGCLVNVTFANGESQWVKGCQLKCYDGCVIEVPQKLLGEECPNGNEDETCDELSLDAPFDDAGEITTVVVDLGTTTVNMAFLDANGHESQNRISFSNPQGAYGADVVSRLSGCVNNASVLKKVSELTRATIKEKSGSVDRIVVSGNTVMQHFLAGWPVDGLASYPFEPFSLDYSKDDDFEILPGLSAFVGADILSGLRYIDVTKYSKPVILLDIGTNAEMALWDGAGKLYVTSGAAGPALEGGNISCGMPSLAGAICHVKDITVRTVPLEGHCLCYYEFVYETIDPKARPVGVCGSGLIDAVALMYEKGIIDAGGLIAEESGFEDGVVLFEEDVPSGTGGASSSKVVLTAEDIQQLLLAKSAIRSGLEILIKKAGLSSSDVDMLFIAGAMGSAINVDSLATLGMIPADLANKAKSIGNSSLEGAIMLSMQLKADEANTLKYFDDLKSRVSVIELAMEPDFEKLFLENLTLGRYK